ncbi:PH domain-containing protein [Pedobacter sp.]|uniref:PH domain-containing protein n=1 Tax=Pedobacter sp. TaxID=1411316 RepID=UPI003D7F3210
MDYRASLDGLAKAITWGTFVLFGLLVYTSIKEITVPQVDRKTMLIHSGIILLLISIIVVCYLLAPQSYKVNADYLTIVRAAGDKKIKLSDIAEVRALEEAEMKRAIRTFGVGGLFGYYGKYYASNIGRMTFYATQRRNKVFILTRAGDKIIITPDDLNIIEKLRPAMQKKIISIA